MDNGTLASEDALVMYFILRKDLNMSVGHIATQCASGMQTILLHFLNIKDNLVCPSSGPYEYKLHSYFKKWIDQSCNKVILLANDKDFILLKDHYKDNEKLILVKDLVVHSLLCDASCAINTYEVNKEETAAVIWPMFKNETPEIIKKLHILK